MLPLKLKKKIVTTLSKWTFYSRYYHFMLIETFFIQKTD